MEKRPGLCSLNFANGVNTLTLTPAAADAAASIKVNSAAVPSGSASPAINLAIGSNVITTVVTSPNALVTATYTVTVTRRTAYEERAARAALTNCRCLQ